MIVTINPTRGESSDCHDSMMIMITSADNTVFYHGNHLITVINGSDNGCYNAKFVIYLNVLLFKTPKNFLLTFD